MKTLCVLTLFPILAFGQVSPSAKKILPSEFFKCSYRGVSYEAVAAPSQTDNWMAVRSVGLSAEIYGGDREIVYVGPYEKPLDLTFDVEVTKGRSSTVLEVVVPSEKYTFDQLLIGDRYPKGKVPNEYLNSIIQAEVGKKDPNYVVGPVKLKSFQLQKTAMIYRDSSLENVVPNPFQDELERLKIQERERELGVLRKKYPNAPDSDLEAIDYCLSGLSGSFVCKLKNDRLEIANRDCTRYFYKTSIDVLLSAWQLSREDLEKGEVKIQLEQGKRIGHR